MADDVQITAGSGTVIATDEVASRHYQLIKPAYGADGSATLVAADTGLPIQSGYKELSGSASANNTDLVSADISGYRWVSVHITSIGHSSNFVSFQSSNDNSNWISTFMQSAANLGGGSTGVNISANSAGIWVAPAWGRYFRVRMTSYNSSTTNVVVGLWTVPPASISSAISQQTSTSIAVTGTGGFTSSDGRSGSAWSAFDSLAWGYNGTNWDRVRTPTTFKSAVATASGNTAVWTPTSSKKFRLMRYKIDVTADAAQSSGGVITIGLQDATTDIGLSQSVFVPTAAGTVMDSGWSSGWIDLGNGKLSATANNVLNVNLSAALTGGTARVVACGTEE